MSLLEALEIAMTGISQTQPIQDRSGPGKELVLAALCLAQFGVVLAFQGTAIVLPEVETALRVSGSTSQWLVSANALAFGGLLLPAGRAADLFGHRRLFLIGTALFAVSSLAAGLAPTAWMLIAARAVQGVGTALSAPAALALLADTFPEGGERRRALARWGAAGPMGGIAAVILGGALATMIGWRAVFMLGVPVAVGALILGRSVLPAHPGRALGRINPLGACAGALGLGLLVFAFSDASDSGSMSTVAIGTLLSGLVLLVAFAVVERRSSAPLVPPELLRQAGVFRAIAVAFFHGAATNTPIVFYAALMQQVQGASPLETGLGFIPCNLAVMAGSGAGSRLVGWRGYRTTMAAGMAIVALGLLATTGVSAEGSYLVTMLPGLIGWGFGLGVAQIGILAAATAETPVSERGAAGGLVTTAAQIGTAVGLALLVAVSGQFDPQVEGIRAAFIGGIGLSLVGILVAFAGFRRARPVCPANQSPALQLPRGR
jgi:MFS family permease